MIIMKEQSGPMYQYRAFENLSAVCRFFQPTLEGIHPRTRYNGNGEIIPQPPLTYADLNEWMPINTTGYIGHFQLIKADAFSEAIPNDLEWHDGRSNAFGRTQEYLPTLNLNLNL